RASSWSPTATTWRRGRSPSPSCATDRRATARPVTRPRWPSCATDASCSGDRVLQPTPRLLEDLGVQVGRRGRRVGAAGAPRGGTGAAVAERRRGVLPRPRGGPQLGGPPVRPQRVLAVPRGLQRARAAEVGARIVRRQLQRQGEAAGGLVMAALRQRGLALAE